MDYEEIINKLEQQKEIIKQNYISLSNLWEEIRDLQLEIRNEIKENS